MQDHRKGARKQRPFLLFTIWLLVGSSAFAADCATERWDERVEVARVFDGDTLELRDGRRVRFIGINTPETAHDARPAEPLADAAQQAVEAMFAASRVVLLRFDAERLDVHKRTLAHVYREDRSSIEAALLEQGLAFAIAIPPNLADVGCYAAVERRAREARRGVWAQPYFAPIPADKMTPDQLGFRRVQGRVSRIGNSKNSIWLNLSKTFALRVDRDDLNHFTGLDLRQLKGSDVVVRGWVAQYKQGDLVMRVRHPAAFEKM